MDIFSLTFIFIFLPTTLLLYYVVPTKLKTCVLFLASLFFYATNSIICMLIMLLSIIFDFLIAQQLVFNDTSLAVRKFSISLVSIKNISLVIYFLFNNNNNQLLTFLGATVYALTSLGYVLDVYHGEIPVVTKFFDYGTFCCFFGKIHVGPIITAKEFFPQLRNKQLSLTNISEGFVLFTHGIAKKILLADNINLIILELNKIYASERTVLDVWLFIFCTILNTYFTLSGYSDMARGVGLMFSIRLPENFRYPLQAYSVSDFFAKFNISANHFVRKYVYKALDTQDNGKLATSVNILLISIIMGLWYGISLNFLMWGAFLGIFIIIETIFDNMILQYIPTFIRKITTFLIILMSFILFAGNTPQESLNYLLIMIGKSQQPAVHSHTLYLLSYNTVLLLGSAFFATDYIAIIARKFELKFPKTGRFASLIINTAILFVSIIFMI